MGASHLFNLPRVLAYITLLVYWSPLEPLWYTWGHFLLLFIIIVKPTWLKAKYRENKRIVLFSLLLMLLVFISFIINYQKFHSSLNNLMWFGLTAGSTFTTLLAFAIIPFKPEDFKKIVVFTVIILLIQTPVGYFQMLWFDGFQHFIPSINDEMIADGFTGTHFNATANKNTGLKIGMGFLLLFLYWIHIRKWKLFVILLILLTGWILGAAMATLVTGGIIIVYFIVIKNVYNLLLRGRVNKNFILIIFILFNSIILVNIIAPWFVNRISSALITTTFTNANPYKSAYFPKKLLYYYASIVILPQDEPSILVFGAGPGNYSSKAAWLVSGELEYGPIQKIKPTPSKLMKSYLFPLWTVTLKKEKYKGLSSIIHHPFSTWISFFVEFGIIGLLLLYLIMRNMLKAIRKRYNQSDGFNKYVGKGLELCVLFIMLYFFIDNTFEAPYAMGQLIVLVFAYINTDINRKQMKKKLLPKEDS